jgi:hypothetical protein
MLARGDGFAPVVAVPNGLLVVTANEAGEEEIVALKISQEDLRRLRSFFRGAPHPYHHYSDLQEPDDWKPLDLKQGK